MLLRLIALGGAALLGNAVQARGVSPYLPLQMSPEIERQIERLLILADQPVLQRPIAAATVLRALPQACEQDVVLCQQVERYLSAYMRSAGIPHASLTAAAGSDESVALANRHGMRSDSAYEASMSAYFQPSDHVLLSGGVLAYEGDTTPTGTLVSMGFEYAQVDLGFRDHWLSPLTDSAMALSTEAPTMPSVTISNYTPLTRVGLRYQLFVAEMSESSNIAFEGGLTSGHPLLGGIHVSIEPFNGWSFGVSRLLQFGGGDRDHSLDSFLDALFNPSDNDNTGTDADFGNQVASLTSQLVLPGTFPLAIYFEYAGEDTSTLSNLRLGNAALSAGVHFPKLGEQFDLTIELGEWQNAWYVHHVYQDGLRHEGNVVGHWGADQRQVNDGVGARTIMARLGWLPRLGGAIEATYRSIDNEEYGGVAYERGQSLEIRYSRPWQQFLLGGEIDIGEDVFGESYSRISVFARF